MFELMIRFRRRGRDWILARIRAIRGKWGEEYGWLASLEARLNALWAWVASIWAAITGWIAAVYSAFVAWITPIVTWLQAKLLWLIGLYNTYVAPLLAWLKEIVTWIHATVILVRDGLEALVKDLYRKWFPEIEAIRREVNEIFTKIADVVSVFDEKLAEKVLQTREEFLARIDSVSRDIRDWALDRIHEFFDPIYHRVNAIVILLEGFIRSVEDRFKPITDLISKTFERPQLARRETVETTGLKWGSELYDSIYEGTTPTPTPEEEVGPTVETETKWVNNAIKSILMETMGPWADLARYIDEEVTEILTGRSLPRRTEIVMPEVEAELPEVEEELPTGPLELK